MSIELPTFDPNIEDVLAEIEKESQGSLLLTTPRKFLAGLRSANPCLEQRHITRSKAEQHLIRTHGAELARAIRILVYLRRSVVSPMGTHRPPGIIVEFDCRAVQASESASTNSAEGATSILRRLQHEAKDGATSDCLTDLEALALAQTLDHSPQNVEYMAFALRDHGQFKSSTRVASCAIDGGMYSDWTLPTLLEARGISLLMVDRPVEAFETFRSALGSLGRLQERPTDGVNSTFGVLASSVLARNASLIRQVEPLADLVAYEEVSSTVRPLARKWRLSQIGEELEKGLKSEHARSVTTSTSLKLGEMIHAIHTAI